MISDRDRRSVLGTIGGFRGGAEEAAAPLFFLVFSKLFCIVSSLKSVSIHQSDSGSSREKKMPMKVNVKRAVIQLPQKKTVAQNRMIMEIPRKKEMK